MTTTVATGAPASLMTAEQFASRYAGGRAELVKGVVKEYPMPWAKPGFVCTAIGFALNRHVTTNGLGRIAMNDSFVRTGRDPDTVRGGDVCYWSYERLPRGEVPEGLLPDAPDLVVEVRSPSDPWAEVFTKVGEYLRAGVRVVVVLDPKTASASVYRAEGLQQVFHNGDEMVIPDVLPGFSARVERLFA